MDIPAKARERLTGRHARRPGKRSAEIRRYRKTIADYQAGQLNRIA